MAEEESIRSIEKELEGTKLRIHKIETYFKIAFAVAFIFGVGGSVGWRMINNVNDRIQKANKNIEAVISNIHKAKTEAISAINDEKAGVLNQIGSHAKSAVQDAFNNGFSSDLIITNNRWGDIAERDYGDSDHQHTTKSAKCPDGSYVAGIKVVYGGTCLGQCNADGGIIRNIFLVCAGL